MLGMATPGLVSAGELSIQGPPALESLRKIEGGGWVPGALGDFGQVDPGTLLMVSFVFQVPSGSIEESHVLTLAIPGILEYQAGTAAGPGSQTLVSFDGGLSFEADRKSPRQQQSLDQSQARSLDPRATHLRFVFGSALRPGVRGYVRYRAVKLAQYAPVRPEEASLSSPTRPVPDSVPGENKP